MMDTYTLMCSKLPELQEGWEPKIRDEVLSSDKSWFIRDYTISVVDGETIYEIRKFDKTGFVTYKYKRMLSYLPSLDQLIGMLEELNCYWEFWRTKAEKGNRYKGYIKDKIGVGGNTPKEVFIQLVAYELYDLQWQDDKGVWG